MVNSGLKFVLRFEGDDGKFTEREYLYKNGIADYIAELAGETAKTEPVLWHMEATGRDRDDKEDYRLKADFSFCVSSTVNVIEYYHNSSFLEYGGSPDRAVKQAFTYALDKYIKSSGKYTKSESKITFADIADCLVLVINSFDRDLV